MTRPIQITSKSNERLRRVRRLARQRSPEYFVVEGHRPVRCALEAGARVLEIFAAPELFLGDRDVELLAVAERRGARVHELGGDAFRSLSRHIRADGLLAIVARPPTTLADVGEFVLVAEGIERPGNLGSAIRTAAAAGADTVIVCDARTDVYHPDVVRGSVGMIFNVRIAVAPTGAAIERLRDHRLVVATPDAALPFWSVDYTRPLAVVLGSERHGVSDEWLRVADDAVAIPMAAAADSLNVAVAAGVVLFEAARRRANGGAPEANASISGRART